MNETITCHDLRMPAIHSIPVPSHYDQDQNRKNLPLPKPHLWNEIVMNIATSKQEDAGADGCGSVTVARPRCIIHGLVGIIRRGVLVRGRSEPCAKIPGCWLLVKLNPASYWKFKGQNKLPGVQSPLRTGC
jgi:hypothetical protein